MNDGNQVRSIALINGRVILPDQIVEHYALVVTNGLISGVTAHPEISRDTEIVDVGGRYISPGLIDIHVHGAEGATFNDPTAESFRTITGACLSRGITSVLATIATAAIPDLIASLAMVRAWRASPRSGCAVLGAHLEGPYFSLQQKGAQDPKHIRTPDDGTVDSLLEYSDIMRIMTFAPELPGATALASRLSERGVVPAMGHSDAKDVDVYKAMERGARHAIHLWSGQSSTIREGAWRKPGLLEASLASDVLTGEMIADNRHLPPTLMKLAWKCFGSDRLCLISDATSGAGLPEGSPFVMGEMEYVVEGGVGMTLERTSFAGSSTLLNQMVPIVHAEVGVPLPEAVRMASLTPARIIGVDDHKGSLESGKDADIAIFNEDFSAWKTMIGGHWAGEFPGP
ncbi:MAG: N-acetylglucosamine-6-phosphate deacetylase [Thermomicrobiales bacterium]